MDFFKELYNGDIYPAEEIAVDIASDPKYKELSRTLTMKPNRSSGDTARRLKT